MSLHPIKRLIFVLTAFAMLSGAMASPVRGVAEQAGSTAVQASEDCLAMKMPCPASKSGPCKMAVSDCAKMLMCCDAMPVAAVLPTASARPVGFASVSYDGVPAALRGLLTEPSLFPPKAI